MRALFHHPRRGARSRTRSAVEFAILAGAQLGGCGAQTSPVVPPTSSADASVLDDGVEVTTCSFALEEPHALAIEPESAGVLVAIGSSETRSVVAYGGVDQSITLRSLSPAGTWASAGVRLADVRLSDNVAIAVGTNRVALAASRAEPGVSLWRLGSDLQPEGAPIRVSDLYQVSGTGFYADGVWVASHTPPGDGRWQIPGRTEIAFVSDAGDVRVQSLDDDFQWRVVAIPGGVENEVLVAGVSGAGYLHVRRLDDHQAYAASDFPQDWSLIDDTLSATANRYGEMFAVQYPPDNYSANSVHSLVVRPSSEVPVEQAVVPTRDRTAAPAAIARVRDRSLVFWSYRDGAGGYLAMQAIDSRGGLDGAVVTSRSLLVEGDTVIGWPMIATMGENVVALLNVHDDNWRLRIVSVAVVCRP